jgi:hypothetical protein
VSARRQPKTNEKKAGAEAEIRFARIKSAVIGPIFNEVVARLVAEGFFGETVVNKTTLLVPSPST